MGDASDVPDDGNVLDHAEYPRSLGAITCQLLNISAATRTASRSGLVNPERPRLDGLFPFPGSDALRAASLILHPDLTHFTYRSLQQNR